MSDVPDANWPFEDPKFRDLVTQLNNAETALQTYVGGKGDVIIDPLSGVPVLLREAQQALLKSEAHHRRLANILQNIQDGVTVTDLEGRITYWNEGDISLYGYTEAEMLGQSPAVLYDDPALLNLFLQNTRTGTEYDVEWEARRKDGSSVWVHTRVTAMRDSEGELVGALRISKNIADRKRAEEALRTSEAKYRTLFEVLPVGVSILNRARQIREHNAALVQILDTTAEQLKNGDHNRWRYVGPDGSSLGLGQSASSRAFNAQAPILNIEMGVLKHEGDPPIWTSVSAAPVPPSGENVVVVTSDITERKEAEDALRESEERFRLYFDLGLVGMAISSPTKSFISVNRHFEAMVGYTSAELVKMNWAEITHPDDLAGDVANFSRITAREIDGYSMDKRYVRKNGQVFYASLSVTCRRHSDGSIDYLMALIQDITERKEAEAALQAKSAELQSMTQQLWQTAKLATMGELAASIAHELNNPLATIQLRVESLLMDETADGLRRRPLEIVAQEADRMAQLVSNLLQFSRRSTQQISTADVCEEIQNTLELIQYHFLHRNIRIVNDCAEDLPMLPVDRQQLRQLFLNLFTNASDAMPAGGVLAVRAHSAEGQIVVEVSDTGQGISPENLAKVMEPFFTTKPEGKGTGLGLLICRRIVQDHGGTFDLESDGIDGHGTTARIKLPLQRRAVHLDEG